MATPSGLRAAVSTVARSRAARRFRCRFGAGRCFYEPAADGTFMTPQQYKELHQRSVDPATREAFWGEAASALTWSRQWDRVLDSHDDATQPPLWRWFPGGELNTCYNCVDRHVEAGRGDAAAIYHDSPVTGSKERISYAELQRRVAQAAGMLAGLGVQKGDRVLIYMPMIPETIVSMLACARLGAVHSVVFGGFASHELAARIEDAGPAVVLAASCGIEPRGPVAYKPLLDRALELTQHRPRTTVIKQRPQLTCELGPGELDWDASTAAAAPHGCVPVGSNDPLYILYTSGTTGKPKGVLRENGGHAVALSWWMEHFHHMRPGDVYFSGSDVGWVVGHSCIVYGPLLAGASTVLFEGKPVGTPDAGVYWRLIEEYRAKTVFVAPTALRAVRQKDPQLDLVREYDISSLKRFLVAGERCDPDTNNFFSAKLGTPIIDNWWQTETGWSMCGFTATGIGSKAGSTGLPMAGVRIVVADEETREPLKVGQVGQLMVPLPLPPAWFTTLWNAPERYSKVVSAVVAGERCYESGDAGFVDEDGYVTVLERTDDVLMIAAHRISPGAIEAVIKAHAAVADAAVFAGYSPLKGEVPLALLVFKDGADSSPEGTRRIVEELKGQVRRNIGPFAAIAEMRVVAELPKTISGKVLRKNLRTIAHALVGQGQRAPVPSTILSREALDGCEAAIAEMEHVLEQQKAAAA